MVINLMHILIISTDKTLVGGEKLGDALKRHQKYAAKIDWLDIIVYTHRREKLSQFKISGNATGYPSRSLLKPFFIFDALRIARSIHARKNIDIIVCQDPFVTGLAGSILKNKFKARLQINFHGDFWDNPSWLKEHPLNFLFYFLSRFTVRRADAIRVMSSGQKEKLIGHNINASKIYVISTPVDLEKYSRFDENKVKQYRKDGQPIILHIGRRDKVKDYATLVKSFELIHQKNPAAILWQVGAGLKYSELHTTVPEKNFRLSGRQSASKIVNVIHTCDVFVLSSTSESFGKVLVEAAACAKPLVSTATSGGHEIIQNGLNGFLVPIGDCKLLAEKIIYLLDHPLESIRMGERGRQLVRDKFGDNLHKIVKLWRDLART